MPPRHQINKPNFILPEIRNFFYHTPSYSSPFWFTRSKRIWESIRLKLCDLHWTPVSCWEDSKILDPTYKVLNSFGPGRCGEVISHPKMWRFIKTNTQGAPSKESFILEIIFQTSLTGGHAVKPAFSSLSKINWCGDVFLYTSYPLSLLSCFHLSSKCPKYCIGKFLKINN